MVLSIETTPHDPLMGKPGQTEAIASVQTPGRLLPIKFQVVSGFDAGSVWSSQYFSMHRGMGTKAASSPTGKQKPNMNPGGQMSARQMRTLCQSSAAM